MAGKMIGVYGDSIAYGYGNHNRSWFDLLSASCEFKNYQFRKLVRNGEKISGIASELKLNSSHFDILFLSAGINDLLFNENILDPASFSETLKIWDNVLASVSRMSSQVVVTSVLPVREKLFPDQPWLDMPMWGKNTDIIRFNQELSVLSRRHQSIFLDLYSPFAMQDLSALYVDAVHLNTAGQNLFFSLVHKQLLVGI